MMRSSSLSVACEALGFGGPDPALVSGGVWTRQERAAPVGKLCRLAPIPRRDFERAEVAPIFPDKAVSRKKAQLAAALPASH